MEKPTCNLYNKILSIKSKNIPKYYSVKKIDIQNTSSSTYRDKKQQVNAISARGVSQNKSTNLSLNGSHTSRNIKLESIIKKKHDALLHCKILEEELMAYRTEIEYKYSRSKSNELFVFPKIITEDQLDDFINEEDESEGILNNYLCVLPSSIYYKKEPLRRNATPLNKTHIDAYSTVNTTLINKEDTMKSSRSIQSIRKKPKKPFGRNLITYYKPMNTTRSKY